MATPRDAIYRMFRSKRIYRLATEYARNSGNHSETRSRHKRSSRQRLSDPIDVGTVTPYIRLCG
jgi:hypothetical protein